MVFLDHIALLVTSLEATSERLAPFELTMGPIETFEAEGTRERYVGREDEAGRLLLIQAQRENGPYGQALRKRGPGLHHVALHVPELETFVTSLSGSGWYLHPRSLETLRKLRTAWLTRPGVACLIEVTEARVRATSPGPSRRVEIPLGASPKTMLSALLKGQEEVVCASPDKDAWLTFQPHQRVSVASLVT